jgi:hypothetical protein
LNVPAEVSDGVAVQAQQRPETPNDAGAPDAGKRRE